MTHAGPRYRLDLDGNQEILFHIDTRQGGRVAVANTLSKSLAWGSEVYWRATAAAASGGLFVPGRPYELVLTVTRSEFVTTVDGRPFLRYPHGGGGAAGAQAVYLMGGWGGEVLVHSIDVDVGGPSAGAAAAVAKAVA